MNETPHPDSALDVPWRTSKDRVTDPGASTLPNGDTAAGMLDQAVAGVHTTIDRLADRAAPAVRQLADGAAAAEQALHARTDQLRDTRDAWVEGARTTVRDNPLACLAAAFTLGAVLARLGR